MRHEVESPVQGSVWKVETTVGVEVVAGDVLLILESMKMEIPVEAPVSGRVLEILVQPEQAVEEEQIVAVIEATGD